MSRIRIVGGTITKTTVGDHNIYSDGNIVYNSGKAITETSDVGISYGEPKDAPAQKKIESTDFDISFELDKSEKTIVPFGILDFKKKEENQFFKFKLKVSGEGINHWQLDIKNQDGIIYTCYSATNELSEVVIIGKSKKTVKKVHEVKTEETKSASFWPAGEYIICWDGFDSNEIYDSARFNNKDLEAKITGTKNGKQKSANVIFSTNYSQVQWTDVKIDKKKKRIDVALRVNLKDGGTKGLDCWNNTRNFNPPHTKSQICDWDKIPQAVLKSLGYSIIEKKTKTFEELRDIVIEGIAQYWGRNSSRGKNVMLDSTAFNVFVNAVNLQDKSKTMDDIPLVYHTNGDWGRSGNPASPVTNIIPDTGIVQQLSYNAGYIHRDWENDSKGLDGWRYQTELGIDYGYVDKYDAITEFKETAAHEIGHEILQAYSGAIFSWQHKGSSYLNQETKPTNADKSTLNKIAEHIPLAPYIPVIKPLDSMPDSVGEYYPKAPKEIDLMKYYNSQDKNGKFVSGSDLSRTFAAENDVLGLIWLTKIKIK